MNEQETLEQDVERALTSLGKNQERAWFYLALAATRALISIAAFLWDYYATQRE